jgi:hypothetical protein
MPRRWASALLGLATMSGVAVAQPKGAPVDIAGAWRFETAPYDGGACRMTGTMTIVRGRGANAYTCTFIATESCRWGQWSAEQRCTAQRDGARVDIASTIVRLTPPGTSYVPDNWSLTIRSSDLMVGELRSADIAGVEFRRGPALVS